MGIFEYDALGRRIRKTDTFGVTSFLWDALQMMQVQRGSETATYLYEPGGNEPLARMDTRDTSGKPHRHSDNYADGDKQVVTAIPENIYYFHNDVSGIPQEMTVITGEIAWQTEYMTWGLTIAETWTRHVRQVDAALAKPISQNLRFQGQYLDCDTRLHYNTFRFYAPDIGRFISPDPIGFSGGLHFYRYAPSPVTWIDPLGWASWGTERKNFWKSEVKNNQSRYSGANQTRMTQGLAPMMRAKVFNTKLRKYETVDVPTELHHATIPQRVGGAGVHSPGNLQILDRWQHAAVDIYRFTGSKLINVIKTVGNW